MFTRITPPFDRASSEVEVKVANTPQYLTGSGTCHMIRLTRADHITRYRRQDLEVRSPGAPVAGVHVAPYVAMASRLLLVVSQKLH